MTLSDLKKLAEGATKGPWTCHPLDDSIGTIAQESSQMMIAQVQQVQQVRYDFDHKQRTANSEFIAACSPERILAMIAVCEAADRYADNNSTGRAILLQQALAALRGVVG